MRRALVALLLAAAPMAALADEQLVLKDGRHLVVARLARRAGKVRFETKDGKVFEVPEDQVVSPPLDSIPGAGAPAVVTPSAPQGPTILELRDGRRISVRRMARRGGRVRIETSDGKVFEVAEGDVVSPPLESIGESASAPAPAEAQGPQLLVLRDGRRIDVTRLARRGRQVLFQTAKGEYFSIPEDQVVSPPLASIPALARRGAPSQPAPPAVSTPAQPPAPAGPAAPPPLPVGEVTPLPPTPSQPFAGTQLSDAEFVPYPDRWDILDKLPSDPRLVRGRLSDPYNQNVLKGDKPIAGDSLFLVLTGTLETPTEGRRLPVIGGVSTADPGSFSFFGRGDQFFTTPRAIVSAELFQGQTAFKPKTWALKATGVFDLNFLKAQERNNVTVDVRDLLTRRREDFALEEAFGEVKLATLSRNYDFVSIRAGIQPFVSDFRGFVFSDQNLGARLFGNLASNRWQYNAAYFDLLEKDTNSELNTFEKREQKVAIANVFRQDVFAPGYTVSASFHWSRDEPNFHYDTNGVLTRPAPVGLPRPHQIESKYVGIAGDGHLGRLNLSDAFYYAFGRDELNVVAGRATDIRAFLGAVEASVDRDWLRFRVSGFWASGDDDPGDDKARGFDSIYDNPNFAGGPFSFWNRSAIALTQTKVLLKPPNTLLPSLRSNKFEGQSNFVNPGLRLAGLGIDAEVTPKVKAVLNANYLWWDKVESLKALLFQSTIEKSIGLDWGFGVVYRPLLNENVVITTGLTGLLPGRGFDLIYGSETCGVARCSTNGRALLNGFVNLKLTY
jgi:hypothetical protein